MRDVVELNDLRAIMRGIATVAEGMGIQTMAERVATDEQLHAVRALECTAVPGFLLGPPMPADQIMRLIDSAPLAVA